MYGRGEGLPKNDVKALEWLLKAANAGAADAQYVVGLHYERGRGTPVDLEAARNWYQRAAEQGNASAACNLGLLYSRDERFDELWPQAAFWLTRRLHSMFLRRAAVWIGW